MNPRSAVSRSFVLVNGRDREHRAVSLRVVGDHIVELNAAPRSGDRVLDLQGDHVLPGLINAHDHLQLNHFPLLEFSGQFVNAREWIEAVSARRRTDAAMSAVAAVDLEQRLFFGGLKNLLAGVTTVAHHDPLFTSLRHDDFPTHVVQHYGWSHSLFVDGPEQVRRSHAATPLDQPWIIHAAEGVDDEAACEIGRLHEIGCLTANTLIVHGVAMNSGHRRQLSSSGAGLIWCPSSNLRLFGRTTTASGLIAQGRVALGTDSRLTGSRDLLDELRSAQDAAALDEATLESLVTTAPAHLLRLHDRGALRVGGLADLLVLPHGRSLSHATRADVRLVCKSGHALYGTAEYVDAVAPETASRVRVDGQPKALRTDLLQRLRTSVLAEPGLDLLSAASRAA